MIGGLTFGQAKAALAKVAENGICEDDPRVISRVNEATAALLLEIIPVNGMMTVDIVADGNILLLPKEMENAIEVEVLNSGTVHGQSDVRQGWFDVVNPFTYVDPSAAHDNPLIDHFLVPDTGDPTKIGRASCRERV